MIGKVGDIGRWNMAWPKWESKNREEKMRLFGVAFVIEASLDRLA